MYKNNYTKNVNGLSVERLFFYDTCLSRHYYTENFSTLCTDKRCDASLLFYCDYGNIELPTRICDAAIIKKNVSNNDLNCFAGEKDIQLTVENLYN